jgi:hypothetical protein
MSEQPNYLKNQSLNLIVFTLQPHRLYVGRKFESCTTYQYQTKAPLTRWGFLFVCTSLEKIIGGLLFAR